MTEKKKSIRKVFNIKESMQEITDYVGGNIKGGYYIESNFTHNKHIRYFLFLRKQGYNINKIMDYILKEEENKKIKKSINNE